MLTPNTKRALVILALGLLGVTRLTSGPMLIGHGKIFSLNQNNLTPKCLSISELGYRLSNTVFIQFQIEYNDIPNSALIVELERRFRYFQFATCQIGQQAVTCILGRREGCSCSSHLLLSVKAETELPLSILRTLTGGGKVLHQT